MSHHRSIFYCLFLAGPDGGRCVRPTVLGKGRPAGGAGPRTWCTYPRKPLFFRFLCTKSPGLFGARPPRTWCTDPSKPLFFRSLCTKSSGLFGARPPGTWCTDPRNPLFFRLLCTKSPDIFGGRPPRTWCTYPRKPLFFRLLCTKSSDIFDARPPRTWCTDPRKPLFFRFLCTKSPGLFGARPPSPPRSSPFLNQRLTIAQLCCIIPSVNLYSKQVDITRNKLTQFTWDTMKKRRLLCITPLPAHRC